MRHAMLGKWSSILVLLALVAGLALTAAAAPAERVPWWQQALAWLSSWWGPQGDSLYRSVEAASTSSVVPPGDTTDDRSHMDPSG